MKLLNKIKSSIFRLIESTIRNISGQLGIKIRSFYYSRRFGKCGKNLRIDEGVIIQGIKNIFLGDYVWIDKYSIIMAGKITIDSTKCKNKINRYYAHKEGELHIGSNGVLGIGTIIQAHGGVQIGDDFSTSPGCKIYSSSNDVAKCRKGNYNHDETYYLKSPITIGNNVWLGFNSIVLGGCIHDDCFIAPNSVVISEIERNAFAEGFPAEKIKDRFSSCKK
ncbi:MAG: acyltransferase [Armatimonadetes bacterium]|nr:acyltransferase [Armatimonadota bacterium]